MQKLHKKRFLASFCAKKAILHENNIAFCIGLRYKQTTDLYRDRGIQGSKELNRALLQRWNVAPKP